MQGPKHPGFGRFGPGFLGSIPGYDGSTASLCPSNIPEIGTGCRTQRSDSWTCFSYGAVLGKGNVRCHEGAWVSLFFGVRTAPVSLVLLGLFESSTSVQLCLMYVVLTGISATSPSKLEGIRYPVSLLENNEK